MEEKLVSIIIPVYNVEKYIRQCVRSLINQDYMNIEIILVDDGSLDKSGNIIDELQKKDKRILVIHQENSGVSSARNKGLSVAKGEYVMFVDGDDWVDEEYVSYFVKMINKSQCDMAMNKNNHTGIKDKSHSKIGEFDAEKVIEMIYMGEIFVAVWNKIYKKSFLNDNHIVFDNNIWYGEGMLFNIECLQYTNTVMVGERAVYHQTFNPDSAMRKFNLKSNICGIKSLELQRNIWKKSNPQIEQAWQYHKYYFNKNIIDGIIRSDMLCDNKRIFNECVYDLRRRILLPLKLEKSLKAKIMWCGYYISPHFMAWRSKIKFKKYVNRMISQTEH